MAVGPVVRRWILFAGWAVTSGVFSALLVTEVLGSRGTVTLDDYASALAPAVAGIACLRVRARTDARSGRPWLLLGLSLLSWASGGAVWTVYEVHLDLVVPFPSWADAGYLLSVPLAVAGLLSFPKDRAVGAARLRPILDGLIAACALLFVSWTTVLGPAFHASTGSLLSQLVALAYPASDVLLVTMTLLMLARAHGRQRLALLLVALGFMLIAVSDSYFAWFTAHAAYDSNFLDTGWVAGFLLIGLGAVEVSGARGASSATAEAGGIDWQDVGDTAAFSRVSMLLPYAPLLISVPWTVALQVRHESIGPFAVDLILVLIIAVLLRQLVSLRVIRALSHQLHAGVEELKKREVELRFQAFHDPLTGLANRTLLSDRVSHALTRARRPGPVIMLLADLDDFKTINDTLGHQAGDALLVSVANRLRAVVRPEDTVARLGGDEFAVLLGAADNFADAQVVADRIGEALLEPFDLSGVPMVIGASIGIAAVDEGATSEELLRDADIAMYAAKEAGKGRFAVFAAELAVASGDRLQLKSDLNDALSRNQLSLKYQPIVDLQTGRISSVEALLRWNHATRGEINPDVFIPLAEANGAIWPIGRWVVQEACAQAGRWEKQRPVNRAPVTVAVNVSGRQLTDPQLLPTLIAALAAAGLAPGLICLEITESVLLDESLALAPLQALQELGVRLAIDDFGTGHSALSRLRRYPIDTLKVDQSFVAALTPDAPVPDVIITAILTLGEGLGMDVIAEGVENDDQLSALRALGCAKAQGFLFARPADPDVIGDLLSTAVTLVDPATTPV